MSPDTDTGRGMGTVAAVRWEDATDLGELWEGDVLDVEVAGEHVLLVRLVGGEVGARRAAARRGGAFGGHRGRCGAQAY